jgi:hypothetical protein
MHFLCAPFRYFALKIHVTVENDREKSWRSRLRSPPRKDKTRRRSHFRCALILAGCGTVSLTQSAIQSVTQSLYSCSHHAVRFHHVALGIVACAAHQASLTVFFDFMFDSSFGFKNGLVLHESLLKLCRIVGLHQREHQKDPGFLRTQFHRRDKT